MMRARAGCGDNLFVVPGGAAGAMMVGFAVRASRRGPLEPKGGWAKANRAPTNERLWVRTNRVGMSHPRLCPPCALDSAGHRRIFE